MAVVAINSGMIQLKRLVEVGVEVEVEDKMDLE